MCHVAYKKDHAEKKEISFVPQVLNVYFRRNPTQVPQIRQKDKNQRDQTRTTELNIQEQYYIHQEHITIYTGTVQYYIHQEQITIYTGTVLYTPGTHNYI